jgi:hypothetical protein
MDVNHASVNQKVNAILVQPIITLIPAIAAQLKASFYQAVAVFQVAQLVKCLYQAHANVITLL